MKETIKIILNKESSIFWNMKPSLLGRRSGMDSFRKGKKKGGRKLKKDNDRREELFT